MGKVLSVATRIGRRFNVENRAHKVISLDKPIPAPRHPTTQKEIDMLMKDHSEALNELKLKHSQLDEHLKQVYVTSTTAEMTKFGKPSDRERPMNRSSSPDSELGYQEPEVVPAGKITLKQALRILTDKQASLDITIDKISDSLNIKQQDAVNLVNYFSSLKIHMPDAVPQISVSQKAKNILLKSATQTKVESVQGSPTPLQFQNPTGNKPG